MPFSFFFILDGNPCFASVDMSELKDGRVHFRRMRGLIMLSGMHKMVAGPLTKLAAMPIYGKNI